jgi:hypothetical protein
LNVGTGGGATAVPNTAVTFTGRHVIRGAIGSAAVQMDIAGNPSPQVAAVPSTASMLLRIGANDVGSVAGAFAIAPTARPIVIKISALRLVFKLPRQSDDCRCPRDSLGITAFLVRSRVDLQCAPLRPLHNSSP